MILIISCVQNVHKNVAQALLSVQTQTVYFCDLSHINECILVLHLVLWDVGIVSEKPGCSGCSLRCPFAGFAGLHWPCLKWWPRRQTCQKQMKQGGLCLLVMPPIMSISLGCMFAYASRLTTWVDSGNTCGSQVYSHHAMLQCWSQVWKILFQGHETMTCFQCHRAKKKKGENYPHSQRLEC